MKKIIAAVICLVMAAVSLSASAAGLDANKQKVLDALKTTITVDGKVVSLPSDYITQAENYLKSDDVTITAAQADAVVEQINEAVKVVKDAGVTSVSDLSMEERSSIIEDIEAAADVVDLTVAVDSAKNTITILKDNVAVATSGTALKVTGPDACALAVIAGIGLALIAGCFIVARKEKLFVK